MTNKEPTLGLSYKHIYLEQNISSIASREWCDTRLWMFGEKYESVLIPSNMSCTISFEKAEELSSKGYFYILHRFYEEDDIVNWVLEMNKKNLMVSISIGLKDKIIDKIYKQNGYVHYVIIDVAHGATIRVENLVRYLNYFRNNLDPSRSFRIIAGNIMTPAAVDMLVCAGADIVKVGIAEGAACTTFNATGICSPMFTYVRQCAERLEELRKKFQTNLFLIADGGIREPKDVAIALVAGADLVMAGSIFAACKDSPATEVMGVKLYYGSASEHNNNQAYIEGRQVELPVSSETYEQLFKRIKEGLQSSMSYLGVVYPSQMRHNARWGILAH